MIEELFLQLFRVFQYSVSGSIVGQSRCSFAKDVGFV
jgi:hypothetical protein